MPDTKTCGRCALYHSEQKICLRSKLPQENTDHCSSFTRSLPSCEICGQMFIPPVSYVIENEKLLISCASCLTALGTCRTCGHALHCDFQENPINLPRMVQQQARQGNMIVSQTVMNPARIAETCEKNCACWDPIDRVCNRQTAGTCGTGYKPSYIP